MTPVLIITITIICLLVAIFLYFFWKPTLIIVLTLLLNSLIYTYYLLFESHWIIRTIIAVGIAIGISLIIYYSVKSKSSSSSSDSKQLIDGMVAGNNQMTFIVNNPLSVNQPNGLEYTLGGWVFINGLRDIQSYQYIFGRTEDPNSSNSVGMLNSNNPCVYISPHTNSIVVVCSTFTSKQDNRITLSNIPIQQWLHISVVCKGATVTCYVNFKPIKEIRLDSVPLQNGDICIGCTANSFDGYISNLVYAPKALDINGLLAVSSTAPNDNLIGNSGPVSMNISILDSLWN